MSSSDYDEEAAWLEFNQVVEIPTVRNPQRKLMLVEFSLKDVEIPEFFTWAPVWKDLVNIVVRSLLVEHKNAQRKTEELIDALNGVGAFAGYLVRAKEDA